MSTKRNSCKNRKRTRVTTTDSRGNEFDAPTTIQAESEETEVNSVEEVQEIVEITVDSCAAKSVWSIQKNGIARNLAVASGSAIRVEGDAKLEIVREGKKCCMKFFGPRRQKTVGVRQRDRGWRKQGRFRSSRIVHRKREHGSKDSDETEKGSVQLNAVTASKAKEKASFLPT